MRHHYSTLFRSDHRKFLNQAGSARIFTNAMGAGNSHPGLAGGNCQVAKLDRYDENSGETLSETVVIKTMTALLALALARMALALARMALALARTGLVSARTGLVFLALLSG